MMPDLQQLLKSIVEQQKNHSKNKTYEETYWSQFFYLIFQFNIYYIEKYLVKSNKYFVNFSHNNSQKKDEKQ